MSDSDYDSVAPHRPGVYVKGDDERVALSNAAAVALVFHGFVRKDESPADDADYRDLQRQAKELGIKATQSADVLRKAIEDKRHADAVEATRDALPKRDIPPAEDADDAPSDNPDAPDLGGDSPLDPS